MYEKYNIIRRKMHCIKDTGGIMEKLYCINMSNLTVR